MTLLTNSFEGGTNTATITTSNSGGTSGNAFDSVTGSPAFSSTEAAHGLLSCEVSVSSATAYVTWQASLGSNATVWFRDYLYFTANPSGTPRIVVFTDPGTGTCALLQLNTTGKLSFLDKNDTAQITTTEAVPLNAWFRVEGFVTGSSSAGQLALNVYNSPDSTTATETHLTAATLNTAGNVGQVNFGVPTSGTLTYWLDDIGVSNTGYLGPVVKGGLLMASFP